MKTSFRNIIFILSLFAVSCSKPTDMLTVINDDGSCYREFTTYANPKFLTGDTSAINPFPVEIDSTWEIQWKYGKSHFRKDFPISKATYDSLFSKKRDITEIDNNTTISQTINSGKDTKTKDSIKNKKSDVKVSVSVKVKSPIAHYFQDTINKRSKSLENKLQKDLNNPANDMSDEIETKVLVIARHNYASVEEMKSLFKLKPSHEWADKKVNYKLKKQFRWFYTYFTYYETYPKINQQLEVPIDKYLTKAEAEFWFSGKNDLIQGMNGVEIREFTGSIEDKYNIWFAHNSWNAEYKVLLANYDKIANPPTSFERLKSLRDTIFSSGKNNIEELKMNTLLNKYFKTNAFSELWKMENSPMKAFEDEFNSELMKGFSESFNYKLIMPGKTIKSENAILHGDTLTWRLTSYRMVQNDFKIEAQSRKANIWAFFLTGIIMLLAIGSFLWKPKR